MITPTARSTTLPLTANSRNSVSIAMVVLQFDEASMAAKGAVVGALER